MLTVVIVILVVVTVVVVILVVVTVLAKAHSRTDSMHVVSLSPRWHLLKSRLPPVWIVMPCLFVISAASMLMLLTSLK